MRVSLLIFFISLSIASIGQSLTISPQKIKLLSWNIYMLPSPIDNSAMKIERAETIGKLLAASDYDVVVFQEAFCPAARRKIKEYLAPVFPHVAGPANQKRFSFKINSGLWIFSRYPIEDSQAIVYKNKTGVDALSRKGALLVSLNVNGQSIQVIGTHMQNAGGAAIRHLQCQELSERLLRPNVKEGVPQILCGDFNINRANEESYQFMLSSLDAADGELVGEQQFSYDRLINDLHTESGNGQDLIDYVLVRENGAWVSCHNRQVKIHRQPWHKNHQDLSDHFSLEAEISFSINNVLASKK